MGKVAADSFRLTNSSVARMPIHVLCNAGGMISEVEIEEVMLLVLLLLTLNLR